MHETSHSTATAGTLSVHGALAVLELRGRGPLVALHAAPMDATAFPPARRTACRRLSPSSPAILVGSTAAASTIPTRVTPTNVPTTLGRC